MTKEEAKLVLDNARPQTKEIDRQFYDDEDLNNALDMAIKSLEQQSSDDCVSRTQAIEWIENLRQMDECFGNYEDDYFPLSEVIDRLKNVPPVTPIIPTCDDCVSRAEVLKQMKEWRDCEFVKMTNPYHYLEKRIQSMSPVTPTRKQSEWYLRGGKFTCKNCEERALLKLTDATGGCREYNYYTSKFCPNCGADMRGSENG